MQDLTKPLKEGYSFSSSNFFNGGWNLMNKEMGTFIGMCFLFLIIEVTLSFIPFLNLIGSLISPILFAGIFIYCRNLTLNKHEASDFFKGFNYTGSIIVYQIIYSLLVIPVIVFCFSMIMPVGLFFDLMTGTVQPDEFVSVFENDAPVLGASFFLLFLFAMFGIIYLSVSYLFVIPLIVDGKLGFWQAMELSRKVVGKKFFSFFFALFIGGFLLSVGTLLTCGFGLLFLAPLSYCIIFSAYDQIFKPYVNEFKDELSSFGEVERDINSESQEMND